MKTIIVDGPPSRPPDEVTYHRFTNEWWALCNACWNRNPSLRPQMKEIVETIATIVCLFRVVWLLVID